MRIHLITAAVMLLVSFSAAAQEQNVQDSTRSQEKLFIELPLVSYPYINEATATTGGFFKSYMNPDMDMSVKLSEDVYTLSHTLLRNSIRKDPYRTISIYLFDVLSTYIPLGYSWTHEEFHRAVMTHRGVNSFDEVLLMKFGASTVSVSHERDEELAAMCDNYRPDFIRLMSAGLEGQTMLVQEMQRKDFFYQRNLYNECNYWMNAINNIFYLFTCATGESDEETDRLNSMEPNIEQRDFTGMDLAAWAYELFNPDSKYADRGTHPSGNGYNRYIKHDQLSADAVRYLKTQSFLECLNILNPMLIGRREFHIASTERGEYYGNACMRHFLTSFGDDITLEALLRSPNFNSYFTIHSYNSLHRHLGGIEAGIVDKRLCDDRLGIGASAHLWAQPESFTTKGVTAGGALKFKASYRAGYLEPYLEAGVKTRGWVAGDVNLDRGFTARLGLRVNM